MPLKGINRFLQGMFIKFLRTNCQFVLTIAIDSGSFLTTSRDVALLFELAASFCYTRVKRLQIFDAK